jgi:phage regulator Rha-like protein
MAKATKAKLAVEVREEITGKIYFLRGQKVMLDFDLAVLYGVETKRLNEQVKRNADRFPEDFMFRLTQKEWNLMRSQIATTSLQLNDNQQVVKAGSQIATATVGTKNRSSTPFAFTEHGVTMLASVLKSERAVRMSITVVRAFIELKRMSTQFEELAAELDKMKLHLGQHDGQLENIYKAIEGLLTDKVEKSNWDNRKRIGFKRDENG